MRSIIALLIAGMVCATAPVRAETEASGNLRYSISVTEFDNQSGWSGRWHIGHAWGAVLTEALQQSGHFIVLGEGDMRQAAMREQDLGASGRTAGGRMTPQVGRMTPAQLLVKGAITHVQHSTTGGSGGIGFRGVRIGGSGDRAEINATVYIVDAATGQVKASTRVEGRAGRRGLRVGYSGGALGGLTGDLAGFQNDNLGKATEDAVMQAVDFLVEQLPTIPWTATVMAVNGNRVTINRGTREGIETGQEFVAGKATELVDPDTGEVLDVEMNTVATLRVTEVRERISYCEPVTGAGAVETGMTLMLPR